MLPSLLQREESLNLHNKRSLFHVAADAWKSNPNLTTSETNNENPSNEAVEKLKGGLLRQQSRRPNTTGGVVTPQRHLTDFEAKVEYLKKRPKSWVQRFVAHVDDTHEVLPTPRTQEELRDLRVQKSGWKNICVSAEELQGLLPDNPKPVVPFTYFGDRSELCLYCSSKIAVGAEMVRCKACPAISHVNCIPNARDFKKDDVVIEREHRANPWTPANLSRQNTPPRLSAATTPDARSRSSSPRHRPETADSGDRLVIPPLLQRSMSRKGGASSSNLLKQAVVNSSNVSYANTPSNRGRPPRSVSASTKDKIPATIRSRPVSSTPTRTTAFTMTTASVPKVAETLVSRQLDWTCQFCTNECLAHDRVNKYKQLIAENSFRKLRSLVLLQSFIRMIPVRIQYLKAKRGIILAQQALRAKWFARKAERERANQRYSYRLRLHDIKMVTRISSNSGHTSSAASVASAQTANLSTGSGNFGVNGILTGSNDNNENDRIDFPALKHAHVIGDIPYEKYERFFLTEHLQKLSGHGSHLMSSSGSVGGGSNHNPHASPGYKDRKGDNSNSPASTGNSINKNRKPSIMSSSSNTSSLMFSDHGMGYIGDHEKHHPLLDFLQHGHIEDPAFAKPFKGGHNLPKGSLFLTVTVHEYEDQPIDKVSALGHVDLNNTDGIAPIQMFRYDFQLKETGRVIDIKPSIMNKLGYEDLPSGTIEKLAKQYQIVAFNTSKPYILIPFTRANVEVRLTLSEVKDWPKSVVLGQSRFNVCYHLTRKKVASFHQTMIPVFDDYLLPEPEEGTRLNVVLPLRPKKTRGGPSYAQANRVAVVAKKDDQKQFSQSIFTWTVITQGNSEWNETGDMIIVHEEASIMNAGNAPKFWCVLLDGFLHTFHMVRESVSQKHCLDIRTCYVSLLPDNAFRVKSSTEIVFFVCESPKDFDVWFKKVYSQSLSHQSVHYATYIKRKPQLTIYTNHNASRKNLMDEIHAVEKHKALHGKQSNNQDTCRSPLGNGAFTATRRDAVFGTLDPHRSTSSRVWIDMMDSQIEKELIRERTAYIINTAKELPDFVEPSLIEAEAKKKSEQEEMQKNRPLLTNKGLSRASSGKLHPLSRSTSERSVRFDSMSLSRSESGRFELGRFELARGISTRFEATTSAAVSFADHALNSRFDDE